MKKNIIKFLEDYKKLCIEHGLSLESEDSFCGLEVHDVDCAYLETLILKYIKIDELSFPNHWGEQPNIQTRDIRKLPEPYQDFSGSSSLVVWILTNQVKDRNEPRYNTNN